MSILKTALVVAAGAASLATIPTASAMRSGSGWPVIATTVVNGRSDTDTIYLPGRQNVRAIKLCVNRAPLRLRDVRIYYRNGAKQDVGVGQRLNPGSCTLRMDLRGYGRDRDITRIRMKYDRILLGSRNPQVQVHAH